MNPPSTPVFLKISPFFRKSIVGLEKSRIFAPQLRKQVAQMAESVAVDALVSNTSGFTSIPVRPRVWVHRTAVNHLIFSCFCFVGYKQGINRRQHPHLATYSISTLSLILAEKNRALPTFNENIDFWGMPPYTPLYK